MPLRNSLILAALLPAAACSGWQDEMLPPPAGAVPPSGPAAYADAPPVEPAYSSPPVASAEPLAPRASTYDNVGYAIWSGGPGPVTAAHATLPPGSFAEVTALDTGRTIVVPIIATARPGREIELSGGAAQELGLQGSRAPVRVRAVNASGPDMIALNAGRPALARPDTPPVLLNALRRKLGGSLGQVTPDFDPGPGAVTQSAPPKPARAASAPPPAARRSGPGYYVQVAALSDAGRARTLAQSLGGSVASAGRLHRVRLGPFDDQRGAQAARDRVAARGYGDARIVRD